MHNVRDLKQRWLQCHTGMKEVREIGLPSIMFYTAAGKGGLVPQALPLDAMLCWVSGVNLNTFF